MNHEITRKIFAIVQAWLKGHAAARELIAALNREKERNHNKKDGQSSQTRRAMKYIKSRTISQGIK